MTDNTSTTSPLRILLVEDSEHDAIAFTRALDNGSLVAEITHLLRAEEAMESLTLCPAQYDLVVADYKLPGMTGLELCKHIISHEIPLPCIIVTGAGAEHVAVEALKAGVFDYLVKDFQQNYLHLLPLLLPEVVNKYRQNKISRIFARERQAVAAISELFLANDQNLDMVYKKLPQILATEFAFPISTVMLLTEDQKEMIIRGITGIMDQDLLGTRLTLEQIACGPTIVSGQATLITDIATNPDRHCFLNQSGIETCLAVPIRGRKMGVLGTITLGDVINRYDADIHIPALQVIANHLGQEIERKQTENEVLLHRDHLNYINIIQQIFLTCTDDTMYVKVLDFLLESMSCQFGYLGYINEQGDLVCPSMTRKIWDKCQVSNKNIVFPKSHWAGLWGKSLLEKRAIFKNGPLDLPVGHVPLMNALAVPVVFQDKLIGQLALADKQVEFTETDKDNLKRIAAQISPVLYARLEQDRHDRKTKEAECLLRKAKEEWEYTFDAMSDIITIQDKDMHIVRANKAAHQFFEAKYGELNGKHCYEIFTGMSAPCSGCPLVETLQDRNEHSAIISHEKLGKIFHVSSAVVFDENGDIAYIVHVAKDITEQKKMEEELFQAHKMEAMGTLAGGIAHDFNNILSAILGFSEFVKSDLPEDSKAREDIEEVIGSGQRAAELVKQILTFSRKADQQRQPFQPHLIIQEALKMLRSTLPTTIAIEEHINPECGSILANPTNIHQVVVNICINACHSMKNEKGTLTVSLSRTELRKEDVAESDVSPGPFVELSIQDTGQGMDKKTMTRIFEPYFTTKDVGKGSGLGLAVIHGIVKSLHGFIRVESELGNGSTFHVYIPALEEVGAGAVSAKTGKADFPEGTERILVVDDESMIVSLHKRILEQLGYTVTATTDSGAALEKIRTNADDFDLVITDQAMPNLSGGELAREILKIKPDMPIILCSGYSAVITEEQALALGIKKYAEKPVETATLAKIVREVLDEKR